MFNTILQRVDRLFFGKPRFSLFTTIYFNFRVLPFHQAIKFPIHLYGKWCFKSLCGSVMINSDYIHNGMLKIGNDYTSYFVAPISNITLHKGSCLVLNEGVQIGQGIQITLYPNASMEMLSNSSIGDNSIVICSNYIRIGEGTRIAWNCQLMDTNSHYVENLETGLVRKVHGKIIIGDYCWICNNNSVMANTIIPNRIIAASRSVLNKNYQEMGLEMYSMIGGMPAKLLKNNVKRNFDNRKEIELHKYFQTHPEEETVKI